MPSSISFNGTTLNLIVSQNSANSSWHNVGIYYGSLASGSTPTPGWISGTFGGSGTFWNYSISAVSLSGVNTSSPPTTTMYTSADSQNTAVNALTLNNLQSGDYAFVVAASGANAGQVGQTFSATSGATPVTATGAIGGNSGNSNTANNNFSSGYVPSLSAGSTTFTFTQDNGVSSSTGGKFSFAVVAVQPSFTPDIPQVVGDFSQATGNPNVGAFNSSSQEGVDFGIWQAADNTWQIWECIRSTTVPGFTRLFYNWQGSALTSTNWAPVGISLNAYPQNGNATDPNYNNNPLDQYGEEVGGLQAPQVIQDATGLYHMFYGSWNAICSLTSTDGKNFTRVLNGSGQAPLFGLTENNPRDPMVIQIGNLWYCYNAVSSSTINGSTLGADYCRTSTDLVNWSAPTLVAEGGQAGTTFNSSECPFVVQLAPGKFYLFRTQQYGSGAQTSVYFSTNPLDFGINNDSGHFIGTIPYCAPEIIDSQGQYYFATLLSSLHGIQICHLNWVGTPVITSSLSIAGATGSTLAYQIVTNSATITSVSGLPTGLTANYSTGVISGTPTTFGTFPINVTLTNSSGTTTETLTLTITYTPTDTPTMSTWALAALALLLLGAAARSMPQTTRAASG